MPDADRVFKSACLAGYLHYPVTCRKAQRNKQTRGAAEDCDRLFLAVVAEKSWKHWPQHPEKGIPPFYLPLVSQEWPPRNFWLLTAIQVVIPSHQELALCSCHPEHAYANYQACKTSDWTGKTRRQKTVLRLVGYLYIYRGLNQTATVQQSPVEFRHTECRAEMPSVLIKKTCLTCLARDCEYTHLLWRQAANEQSNSTSNY